MPCGLGLGIGGDENRGKGLTSRSVETGRDIDCQNGTFDAICPSDEFVSNDLIVRAEVVESGMHA